MASISETNPLRFLWRLFRFINLDNFREFKHRPYDYADELSIKFRGYELNFLADDARLRRTMLIFAALTGILWALMGFDSTWGQIQRAAESFLSQIIFERRLEFIEVAYWYGTEYGKNMHLSAFTIYSLCFYGLSKYYSEELSLTGSRNFVLSFGITFLSIGAFELAWQYLYALGQDQWWVVTWAWPQLRILVQCLIFTVSGVMVLLMVCLRDRHHPENTGHFPANYGLNLDARTAFIAASTLVIFALWYYYPLPVTNLTVERIGAPTWTNTARFPQTLYTVETNVLDSVNAGDQFYVPDDLIHGLNTLAKVAMTWLFYQIGKLNPVP